MSLLLYAYWSWCCETAAGFERAPLWARRLALWSFGAAAYMVTWAWPWFRALDRLR